MLFFLITDVRVNRFTQSYFTLWVDSQSPIQRVDSFENDTFLPRQIINGVTSKHIGF